MRAYISCAWSRMYVHVQTIKTDIWQAFSPAADTRAESMVERNQSRQSDAKLVARIDLCH